MARKFIQGTYIPKNPEKYVGHKSPNYKSSWESNFMIFLDTHPSVTHWSYEPIRIPYRCPISGKGTVYVPDFLVVYKHQSGQNLAEVVEIKPMAQAVMREGKMKPHEQATVLRNRAKWAAATMWCKNYGLNFRVITEENLFFKGTKKSR